MPRRKYGHMQKPIPPVKPENCRFCRLKRRCPVHEKSEKDSPHRS